MFQDNFELVLMTAPFVIFLIIFQYIPLFGIILPFKNYRYDLGILGSPWAGLDNFKFFFNSPDFFLLMRNSIGYSLLFLLVNNIAQIALAFAMYEVKSKFMLKYYQTTMVLPNFMSWVVVAYVVYAFFDPRFGILNEVFGKEISWYTTPEFWPFILAFVNCWKGIGMGSIMYYAALMGIDRELFEAATIDGASKSQQRRYICLPCIKSIIGILLIMGIGNILGNDFGLFYQIPMDVSLLYPTTDVIETYVFRGLRTGDMSMTAAVGLFQSAVGLVILLTVNFAVKKVDPDSAMF